MYGGIGDREIFYFPKLWGGGGSYMGHVYVCDRQ